MRDLVDPEKYPMPPTLRELADVLAQNWGVSIGLVQYAIGIGYAMGHADGKLDCANELREQMERAA